MIQCVLKNYIFGHKKFEKKIDNFTKKLYFELKFWKIPVFLYFFKRKILIG